MKKQRGLVPKILGGEKTVESRWYKNKKTPWNKIKPEDTIYFKDSGEKVSLKAKVTGVEQYEIQNNEHAREVMGKYSLQDLGTSEIPEIIEEYISNKNYAIFVHFDNVEKIEPFDINKTGFGTQAAWLTVASLKKIKRT